jgi:phosphatidylethanolamine-binding protein (PEBP) family uncharacterized protein
MRRLAVAALMAALAACSTGAEHATLPTTLPHIEVTSDAFGEGERIPTKFTCDGDDVPPPFAWGGVPSQAARVAIVVDDPDAPGGTFLHWTVILPASSHSVPADVGGYRGPCPPPGKVHHYRFSVYALAGKATPTEPDAIRRQAIAGGTLTGTYSR